jgi:galactose mutarotase-like enzyme
MKIRLDPKTIDSVPSLCDPLPVAAGDFRLGHFQLTNGRQKGCELIVADCGRACIAVCPTRGMSIWKAQLDGVDCQWNSPVDGPVHPSWVATNEPSGLGWLDGFDELLVRCGLRSFGPPEFDQSGKLLHPLHGRVANLPAQNVSVQLNEDQSELSITGEVVEARFLMYHLRLAVEYRLRIGEPTIGVHDRVTNHSGLPTSMQLLYHINFGSPILDGGAKLHLAAPQIVARDARAVHDLSDWSSYKAPEIGYAEQVYFSQPHTDSNGWAQALLVSPDADFGAAVRYQTATLPYFTQWKNTVDRADGYVTGLEPGTGLPNAQSFERQHNRLVHLAAGQSIDFHLNIEGISDRNRISQIAQQISDLQADGPPRLLKHLDGWTKN